MKNLFAVSLIAVAIIFTPSCSVLQPEPPTKEAVIYFSLKDTWSATHAAYRGFKEQQAQGKVSTQDAADVDKAWNQFRDAMKLAVKASRDGFDAPTPESITKLKNNLIELILAL